jgi:hypothetical protein
MEQFAKLPYLNNTIDKNANFANFANFAKIINVYIGLQVMNYCSVFEFSYFCVHEKKVRELREDLKHMIPA